MNYSAVIFDLDGVLCSTDKFHYTAWRKIAAELGMQFNKDINDRLRGVGRMESFEIILEVNRKELTEKQKRYYVGKKNSIYVHMLKDMSPDDVDGDVRLTLTTLRNYGIKTAVGSSSRNAKLILKKTGLREYFDAVSDGTNISRPKPYPEVFLKAAKFIKVPPKECIVVEDAVAGIDAAVNAGMDSAAIGSAAGYEAATYSLKELSDLLRYI